ncbi:hypothetical protein AK812_SmicGene46845, partial [Symbiodinium microadriaticum]
MVVIVGVAVVVAAAVTGAVQPFCLVWASGYWLQLLLILTTLGWAILGQLGRLLPPPD